MTKQLWINLPVKDIHRSTAFFTKLGFQLNLQFGSHKDSASLLFGTGNFVVMLFHEPLFEGFANAKTADTNAGTEVLFSIDAESVEEVNELAQKVLDAGGSIYAEPGFKDGWIYGFGFIDLDGHRWNILYMDLSKMPMG